MGLKGRFELEISRILSTQDSSWTYLVSALLVCMKEADSVGPGFVISMSRIRDSKMCDLEL